jgi:hypothetical protein
MMTGDARRAAANVTLRSSYSPAVILRVAKDRCPYPDLIASRRQNRDCVNPRFFTRRRGAAEDFVKADTQPKFEKRTTE